MAHYCVKPRLNLLNSTAASAVTQPNAEHVIHAKYKLNTPSISYHLLPFSYFTHSSNFTLLTSQISDFNEMCKANHILIVPIAFHIVFSINTNRPVNGSFTE